ncbi:hypothetical protein CDN99_07250 [Roseateles aquatilis]|uniref:Type IV pilus biogenesis protein PilP n=1 Tax=Roseateles aquatilis TaxID=431061 RepID=A0A246JIQ8_9BURK|nr:hypothetical protein [Roseateles aquatilis]OWQ92139.1 hypothetical protein CDN99_07250 [Roseateles aquatilis]
MARLIRSFLLTATATAASGASTLPEAAAATTRDPTLRELIDVARRNKSAELHAAATRLAEAQRTADTPVPAPSGAASSMLAPATHTTGPTALDGPPKLWSLTAVGVRWHAEILYGGRIRSISVADVDRRQVGPWQVVGLTDQGLMLQRPAPASSAAGAPPPPRQLLLKPPSRGTALGSFKFEAPASPPSQWSAPTPSALASPSHRLADAADAAARAASLPLPGASTVDDGNGPADDD